MTSSSICGRAPMTPFRAEDRKSMRISPRPLRKRKTAASDTRAERYRAPSGNAGRRDAPKVRPEEIDNEFRQQRMVAAELARRVHGSRGHVPVRKTARA